MHKIKLDTWQAKVENIVLALGGKPDEEIIENTKNQNEFEAITATIKK